MQINTKFFLLTLVALDCTRLYCVDKISRYGDHKAHLRETVDCEKKRKNKTATPCCSNDSKA